ncbi:MAG: DJ-1/PfpI family protein [Prevotella sp.]|nr:DJ-1/PfpI family protein [Prevotella sp.]
MAKIYEFLADGFEIIEALAPVDILRRGGMDVTTVSIMHRKEVVSAQHLTVVADALFEDIESFDDADLLLLPGGWPGADNLNKCEPLRQLLVSHNAKGRHIGAICAAPMVLGTLGLLKGERATCYPGFEEYLEGAEITHEIVTESGLFTTGEGPAAAMPYAYTLLSHFLPSNEITNLQEGMRYLHLMQK